MAFSHSARTSCGFSRWSASADRATCSKPITRSSGDGAVRTSIASRSTSSPETNRRRDLLIASASRLTTVCNHPPARSASSRAAWRMRISSPRW
jgi:hypothetical protein